MSQDLTQFSFWVLEPTSWCTEEIKCSLSAYQFELSMESVDGQVSTIMIRTSPVRLSFCSITESWSGRPLGLQSSSLILWMLAAAFSAVLLSSRPEYIEV